MTDERVRARGRGAAPPLDPNRREPGCGERDPRVRPDPAHVYAATVR